MTGPDRTGEPVARLPVERLDAVIFDLEGVLTDTTAAHFRCSTCCPPKNCATCSRGSATPGPKPRCAAPSTTTSPACPTAPPSAGWCTPGYTPAPTAPPPGPASPRPWPPTCTTPTQGGTTGEGIHLGAMAGTVDLAERCYLGLETRDDALWLNPRLPDQVTHLHTTLTYRGHRLQVTATPTDVTITASPCAAAPVTVRTAGRLLQVTGAQSVTVPLPPTDVTPQAASPTGGGRQPDTRPGRPLATLAERSTP